MIPKVRFIVGNLSDYLPVLNQFILKEIFLESFSHTYPDLLAALKTATNKEETIELYFKTKEEQFSLIMRATREHFQAQWNLLNDMIMPILEQVHETKWQDKEFIARVTLNPVCPRYLKNKLFDVYFGIAESRINAIVLHELSHFIFFQKFKEIYPNVNEREFNRPHLLWKFSEMLPQIVLKDKRITSLFDTQEALVYENIQTILIGNKKLLDIFQKFYTTRKDFTGFIQKAYAFTQEHEAEIKQRFH